MSNVNLKPKAESYFGWKLKTDQYSYLRSGGVEDPLNYYPDMSHPGTVRTVFTAFPAAVGGALGFVFGRTKGAAKGAALGAALGTGAIYVGDQLQKLQAKLLHNAVKSAMHKVK